MFTSTIRKIYSDIDTMVSFVNKSYNGRSQDDPWTLLAAVWPSTFCNIILIVELRFKNQEKINPR